MHFRPLARAAPFVLGAVAAGVWLHRRHAERPALREVSGELPPPVPPARFRRPVKARFARAAARRPIDIVTIVDDLLGAAR
ncbi:MAG: hypothetical protein QOD71_770 [Thermoleophilaceae bacterium]|nr:hypothetical protein [Thermoleophilaceae bacterium]